MLAPRSYRGTKGPNILPGSAWNQSPAFLFLCPIHCFNRCGLWYTSFHNCAIFGFICNYQHAPMVLELIVYAHAQTSSGGGVSESERCQDPIPSSLRKACNSVVSCRKTRRFSPQARSVRLHCTSVQIAVPSRTNRYY